MDLSKYETIKTIRHPNMDFNILVAGRQLSEISQAAGGEMRAVDLIIEVPEQERAQFARRLKIHGELPKDGLIRMAHDNMGDLKMGATGKRGEPLTPMGVAFAGLEGSQYRIPELVKNEAFRAGDNYFDAPARGKASRG